MWSAAKYFVCSSGMGVSSYFLFITNPPLWQFCACFFVCFFFNLKRRLFGLSKQWQCCTYTLTPSPAPAICHSQPPRSILEQHLSQMSKTPLCTLLTSVPQQIVPNHSFLLLPLQLPLSPLLSNNPCLVLLHSSQNLCHFNPRQYCTRCCKLLLRSSLSCGKLWCKESKSFSFSLADIGKIIR